ncbi:hypothetical protein L1069_14945 [Leisingera sp. MMG025]|nr:hypothetical protein [Leisingera sp. MMG026]
MASGATGGACVTGGNNPASAERRFKRVAARISPAGRKYCETLTAERGNFD